MEAGSEDIVDAEADKWCLVCVVHCEQDESRARWWTGGYSLCW